jgi:hypothetical protein
MTPEQLENILEKAEAVPPLRAAVDAANSAHSAALTNAQNAKAAWLSAVDANSDDTTLTSLANQYIATAVLRATLLTAAQAASGPLQTAIDELEAACQAVISEALNPPPG